MKHLGAFTLALPVVAILFWASGQFAEDLSRVLLGIVVVIAVWARTITAPSWAAPAFRALLCATPMLVLAHGWSRVLAGRMGIDFALFSQCVHSISTTGLPMTSLLGLEPVNFLTHHFAPILYLPGALAFVGVDAPLALLLAQAIAFAASLLGLHVAARRLGLGELESAAWTLVIALSPNVRPELLWGVHDEVLSVPFVIWGFVALLSGRPVLSMVLVLASALGKESYFALAPLWCFVVWRWTRPPARVLIWCGVIAAISIAGGAFYVFGQPIWADKPFDHFGKLAPTAATLGSTLGARGLFLLSFFAGVFFLPLLSARARLLCLIAAPFIGLGLIAEDTEMYRLTGYHSIVPQVLLGLAGAVGLADAGPRLKRVVPLLLAALLLLQLSWNARSLWKPAREAVAQRWYPAPQLSALPRDELIAVDPAAALVLFDHRVVRVFTAEEQNVPVSRVVARPEGWELPGPKLNSTHVPCALVEPWLTLCPK